MSDAPDPEVQGEIAGSQSARLTALALAILTASELTVLELDAGRRERITALAGLLMAKVGLVFVYWMRGGVTRLTSRLTLAAVVAAVGFAVVLMLESAYRAKVGG